MMMPPTLLSTGTLYVSHRMSSGRRRQVEITNITFSYPNEKPVEVVPAGFISCLIRWIDYSLLPQKSLMSLSASLVSSGV